MLPDYYAILGIPQTATAEEIRRAYRKAAFAAHPDRGGSDRLMQRINEAWDVLGDEDTRQAYDIQRTQRPREPRRPSEARRQSAAKGKSRPRQPRSSIAGIAGSIVGRAFKTFNRWIEPSAPKKTRSGRAAGTVVLFCRFCGQKIRLPRGADRIRCPKCHRSELLK